MSKKCCTGFPLTADYHPGCCKGGLRAKCEHDWRVVECDNKWDVLECRHCKRQRKALCTFDEDMS